MSQTIMYLTTKSHVLLITKVTTSNYLTFIYTVTDIYKPRFHDLYPKISH